MNHGTVIASAVHREEMRQAHADVSVAVCDMLKSDVERGEGIEIKPNAAYEAKTDSDLTLIDISQLIEPCYSGLLFRPDSYLRGYIYDFIGLFNPSLTKERLDQLLYAPVIEDFSI